MKAMLHRLPARLVLAGLIGWMSAPAFAASEQALIDQARLVVNELKGNPHFDAFRELLGQSKAVVVVPELVKAGFIFGGEIGTGVLLARDPATGEWSYPAFYTMTSGSFGLQIGVQVSKVILLVMTDGGLDKLMSANVTLGADANIAAGPIGAGVQADTTLNVDVDIYSFATSKGLFGGISLEGGVLVADDDAGEAYYNKPLTARGIVILRQASNPGADDLRAALGGR